MLSVLRRSDEHLFKFVSAEQAQDVANRLQEGHCFEVQVIASLKVDSFQETAMLEEMAPFHTAHGWYAVDLDKLLSAWLDSLEIEEPESEESNGSKPIQPKQSKTQQPNTQAKTKNKLNTTNQHAN